LTRKSRLNTFRLILTFHFFSTINTILAISFFFSWVKKTIQWYQVFNSFKIWNHFVCICIRVFVSVAFLQCFKELQKQKWIQNVIIFLTEKGNIFLKCNRKRFFLFLPKVWKGKKYWYNKKKEEGSKRRRRKNNFHFSVWSTASTPRGRRSPSPPCCTIDNPSRARNNKNPCQESTTKSRQQRRPKLVVVFQSILRHSTVIRVQINKKRTIPDSRCSAARFQFHQHFIRNFFAQKCFAHLFSTYILAL